MRRFMVAAAVVLVGGLVEVEGARAQFPGSAQPRLMLPGGPEVGMMGFGNGNGGQVYSVGGAADTVVWRASLGHSPVLVRETHSVRGRAAYDPVSRRWAVPTKEFFPGQWVSKGVAVFDNGARISLVTSN